MNVLKYSVHWFGNRRKKALTDGQVHNVMPPRASLSWSRQKTAQL